MDVSVTMLLVVGSSEEKELFQCDQQEILKKRKNYDRLPPPQLDTPHSLTSLYSLFVLLFLFLTISEFIIKYKRQKKERRRKNKKGCCLLLDNSRGSFVSQTASVLTHLQPDVTVTVLLLQKKRE